MVSNGVSSKLQQPAEALLFWSELDRVVRQRDRWLMRCYWGGLALAIACFFLPTRLSQMGSVLLMIGFTHMMVRLYCAHRQEAQWELWLTGAHPRLALIESLLFNLPLLVGANLVFMGIPLGSDRLLEAILDCVFLGLTVLLLSLGHWWNLRVLRTLVRPVFCVGGKAIPSSRSE